MPRMVTSFTATVEEGVLQGKSVRNALRSCTSGVRCGARAKGAGFTARGEPRALTCERSDHNPAKALILPSWGRVKFSAECQRRTICCPLGVTNPRAMPTYDYICTKCSHAWELEQRIIEDPIRKCPKCGANTAKRQISSGAGFILKGGGWYADGYGSKKSSSDASKSDDKAAAGESKTEKT